MNTVANEITFNPKLMSLGLKMPAALFLSQAISLSEQALESDGWFTKTIEEWEELTGLTRYQQTYARNKLKKMKILKQKQLGMPRRIYFLVDVRRIETLLSSLSA